MVDRATTISTDQPHPQSEGDRELVRVLALLEGDQAGSMTVAELRERGVKAPGQAVYTLQLAGYAIDRVSGTDLGGDRALGYRLHSSGAPAPSVLLVGSHEVDGDDA